MQFDANKKRHSLPRGQHCVITGNPANNWIIWLIGTCSVFQLPQSLTLFPFDILILHDSHSLSIQSSN